MTESTTYSRMDLIIEAMRMKARLRKALRVPGSPIVPSFKPGYEVRVTNRGASLVVIEKRADGALIPHSMAL